MFLKQRSRYQLIGLFKFMFGKESLKSATKITHKYRVNQSEGVSNNTILQSENV